MRVGPRDILEPELTLHKKLLYYGFPIAKIIEEGELEKDFYYIEASLGNNVYGNIFAEDWKKNRQISDENFKNFLEISKKFAVAQLKTAELSLDDESFYLGIHVNLIIEELPDLKDKIIHGFEKVKSRTKNMPLVLTHGDLNPFNILEKGVIDFGSSFHAPAGYDIISCIYQNYNFPKSGDYESNLMRLYDFSSKQTGIFFREMKQIYSRTGTPNPLDFADDFVF